MPLEGLPNWSKSDVKKWVEAASYQNTQSPWLRRGLCGDDPRPGDNGFLAREDADWPRLLIERGRSRSAQPRCRDRTGKVRATRMMAGQVATRRDWYRSLYRPGANCSPPPLSWPGTGDRLASL